MKKREKVLTVFVLLAVALCWAVLSFYMDVKILDRFSLWSNLVFGTGSIFIAVTALFISIDANRKAEKIRIDEIKEKASNFIVDNNEEIDNIPLCMISSAYNRNHKYERKIYNNFNALTSETQKEVLSQLNYNYKLIDSNNWIDESIDLIKTFISENDLGADFLYDDAKYYRRMMLHPKTPFPVAYGSLNIFPDNFGYYHDKMRILSTNNSNMINFYDYLVSYKKAKIGNTKEYQKHKSDKPIDLLIAINNLRSCDEPCICYWVYIIVYYVAYMIIEEKKGNGSFEFMSSGDAVMETYEDRYLFSLMELYNLSIKSSSKNEKKK